MTGLGLGLLLLLSILFGSPALATVVRQHMARRRAAAKARQREEADRRQRALDAQQQAEHTWRNSPDPAGVGEYLRYLAATAPLEQAAAEARRRHEQSAEQVDHHLSRYPGGKPPSTRYRLVVLTGLVFFVGAFALAITLDYLVFRGLHPSGSVVLPFGLACLAVMGITVGSVIMFGAKRHDLLPEKISEYGRQVVIVGGALLALCIAGYIAEIAPNRSYPAGQAAISQAEQVLQADQSAVPPASPQLIVLDQAAVTRAEADLSRAQLADKLSAGALAFVEIPLSEAAVLGGELLVLSLAVARRERARQEHQQAEDALVRADIRFVAELTQILLSHGHNEESVRRIIDRGNAMNPPRALHPAEPRVPGLLADPGPPAGAPPGRARRRLASSLADHGQHPPPAAVLTRLPTGLTQLQPPAEQITADH